MNQNDGSTCVACIIKNNIIYTANCGDSRAILCNNDNHTVELSIDHKPNRKDEKNRIKNMGGFVENVYGCYRVNGILAVSRSFGDRKLKKYIIATPEIKTHTINKNDKFIVIASDGLWDTIPNDKCIKLVENLLKQNYKKNNKTFVFETCRNIVDISVQKGSDDNVTCTIIILNDYFLH